MNTKPELTLANIRNSDRVKVFQASDLVTKKQKARREESKRKAQPRKKRLFDDVDAYVGEMIARFGYDFYQKWNHEELNPDWVNKLMLAERARERAAWIPIEGFLRGLIQGGVPTFRPKKKPTAGRLMLQVIKEEIKAAKGER